MGPTGGFWRNSWGSSPVVVVSGYTVRAGGPGVNSRTTVFFPRSSSEQIFQDLRMISAQVPTNLPHPVRAPQGAERATLRLRCDIRGIVHVGDDKRHNSLGRAVGDP